MFEPGITPTPPSPIKGEDFTLSFYGQLFTRHYTSSLSDWSLADPALQFLVVFSWAVADGLK
jgi:hypothetical protein